MVGRVLVVTCFLFLHPSLLRAQEPAPSTQNGYWEFSTGALWSVGTNATPLDYLVLPQVFAHNSLPHFSFERQGWGEFVFRGRHALLLEPIVEGPESYFIGATGGGKLEWWLNDIWMMSFGAGGGVGVMDSKGKEIPGGQGQDFNLTWYARILVQHRFRSGVGIHAGVFFQHISNGGMDDVNPGLDALGPTLGFTIPF